ncbi:hypothetical protein ONA70_20885 [Micromonospora yasonensis]|uniref:hypothetical protein n=1 Tax=Micromonospora yasonensis TaxID=1128667 RepID=UPI00222F2569|nr:hypothetical protein [Micromonospora yasonensis]MCW3842558.1 hypothetical protein [Micromonospora yasonensis]
MPSFGDLFADLRGEDRTMRVSYHPDRGAVVLSLWNGTVCRGSFRMPVDDLDRLLTMLADVRQAAVPAPPAPGGAAGSGPAAVEGSAALPSPSVERTGDITGTAHRLTILPTPRVA